MISKQHALPCVCRKEKSLKFSRLTTKQMEFSAENTSPLDMTFVCFKRSSNDNIAAETSARIWRNFHQSFDVSKIQKVQALIFGWASSQDLPAHWTWPMLTSKKQYWQHCCRISLDPEKLSLSSFDMSKIQWSSSLILYFTLSQHPTALIFGCTSSQDLPAPWIKPLFSSKELAVTILPPKQ